MTSDKQVFALLFPTVEFQNSHQLTHKYFEIFCILKNQQLETDSNVLRTHGNATMVGFHFQ